VSHQESGQEEYDDGDVVARKTFFITIVAAVLFCGTVFLFIL
jgi:hypothetical protein